MSHTILTLRNIQNWGRSCLGTCLHIVRQLKPNENETKKSGWWIVTACNPCHISVGKNLCFFCRMATYLEVFQLQYTRHSWSKVTQDSQGGCTNDVKTQRTFTSNHLDVMEYSKPSRINSWVWGISSNNWPWWQLLAILEYNLNNPVLVIEIPGWSHFDELPPFQPPWRHV